jgi:rhamnosyltransferase
MGLAAVPVAVVIPTLNAARMWHEFSSALAAQTFHPKRILVIDSSSSDGTPELAREAGYEVLSIPRAEFKHGGTRQMAVDRLGDAQFIVFLTQDAVLAGPDALMQLLAVLSDPQVGAAYGRQLPRAGANPIETHARLFNYPPISGIRDLSSRERLGFKSIFISNSFAVYRRDALMSVGGFPDDVIFGEDTITAAKLLKANWEIAYVAESQVYHSHSYNWRQEFRRYFDIGVLHHRESWLLREFGQTGSEGRRFVASEIRYLLLQHWWLVPSAFIRTVLKLFGYRLGRNEDYLRPSTKRKLSMQPSYWI